MTPCTDKCRSAETSTAGQKQSTALIGDTTHYLGDEQGTDDGDEGCQTGEDVAAHQTNQYQRPAHRVVYKYHLGSTQWHGSVATQTVTSHDPNDTSLHYQPFGHYRRTHYQHDGVR